MAEFFIKGSTFAAPFVGDPISRYMEADTAEEALRSLALEMHDGIGLYSANAYVSADDYHKNQEPLAKWRSNKAITMEGATSVYSDSPGLVEVDGELRAINDPKAGQLVT